jgi:hypothetical protein
MISQDSRDGDDAVVVTASGDFRFARVARWSRSLHSDSEELDVDFVLALHWDSASSSEPASSLPNLIASDTSFNPSRASDPAFGSYFLDISFLHFCLLAVSRMACNLPCLLDSLSEGSTKRHDVTNTLVLFSEAMVIVEV